MVKKATIEFEPVGSPCIELVTKFGGQPVWLDEPEWPFSRSTQKPMKFICQIVLEAELFPNSKGKIAYLFMADDSEDFVDGTYEPDGGENALIIQPGKYELPTIKQATGPTLYKMVEKAGHDLLIPLSVETCVRLIYGEDPELVSEEVRWKMSEAERAQLPSRLDENKIGGTPVFLQGDEFPVGGPWRLLLQLDSCSVPFSINFGDAGVGYAFISEDGTHGKFLWQCC